MSASAHGAGVIAGADGIAGRSQEGRRKLDAKIGIAAPTTEVRAFILDPARLSRCVSGVRDVQAGDELAFTGRITAAVGPMQPDFEFRSVIVRADFPRTWAWP